MERDPDSSAYGFPALESTGLRAWVGRMPARQEQPQLEPGVLWAAAAAAAGRAGAEVLHHRAEMWDRVGV